MLAHFGPIRAASVAQDHVFGTLGGLSANQALAGGADARRVWLAVCDTFDVPESLRYGLPDDDGQAAGNT